MSTILAALLEVPEPLLARMLQQLERASNQHGRDARLIADVHQGMWEHVRSLGLDPNDTSPRELEAAQRARLGVLTRTIASRLAAYRHEEEELFSAMLNFLQQHTVFRDAWVLKRSVAKALLKALPPKRLMKHLGYRSVDSLLKHERCEELYAVVGLCEDQAWLDAFSQQFETVTPSDFEMRPVACVNLSFAKYGGLLGAQSSQNAPLVVEVGVLGVVGVVLATHGSQDETLLALLLMVVRAVNEVRLQSAWLKLKQVRPRFGQLVAEYVSGRGREPLLEIAGQPLPWRVVGHYFSRHVKDGLHPEVFQPHVQPEDLQLVDETALLAEIDPQVNLWQGPPFAGEMRGAVRVTANLVDASFHDAYGDRQHAQSAHQFKDALWRELYSRYLDVDALRDQVLRQLD